MSRQIALDSICLRPTPRWGHTEYSLAYHKSFVEKLTGLPPGDPKGARRLDELCHIDFLFSTEGGLHGDWQNRGRVTDMGHAVYAADGSDLRQPAECPFATVEEVWAFDAVKEYGLPDFDEQVKAYEQSYRDRCAAAPNQLCTGGYYRTIVSGAIQTFGWDMLLLGAADPVKMEKVLDSFFRNTLFYMQAWAKTSVEVVIQHDDFVWTSGAFMHPDIYRKVIIPRYAELWKPLRAAGKKILFCSDGTFTEFTDDLVEAGAEGFIFEPTNEFEFMVERYGGSHVLIGSCTDCRDMAFRDWETVRRSVDRTFELAAQGCKGLIYAVGNHIPANVSDEMLEKYFEYLTANWFR